MVGEECLCECAAFYGCGDVADTGDRVLLVPACLQVDRGADAEAIATDQAEAETVIGRVETRVGPFPADIDDRPGAKLERVGARKSG
jgi:hypothetical protein